MIPLAAAMAAVQLAAAPPEPEGFRGEPYRAPVPASLQGAEVIDGAAAERLWREGRAVFVDVLPRAPRPEGLPDGTIWREPPHETIANAVWLPNIGYERLSGAEEAYLAEGLAAATAGARDAPLVVFCLSDCWMSWNAAKRAVALGYEDVHWFPEGVDGWKGKGLPTEVVTPFEPR